MKLRKIILSSLILACGVFTAKAQEEVTEYFYNPNWYIQGQFGAQETLGETSFGRLLSPNAQLGVGVNFNPYVGMRLSFNGWESKAASHINSDLYKWKWNYMSGNIDVMFNLCNILGGYNPNRLVDVDLFGGIGCNLAWNNKQAAKQNALYRANYPLATEDLQAYLWKGHKTHFMGRFGMDLNFNVSQHVAIGIELSANMLGDTYNSKKADNIDWYFNGLVGIKYTFGKKYKKVTRVIEPIPCDPVIVEKVVEKIVEVPVEVQVEVEKVSETFQRDIFFTISNSQVDAKEEYKVKEVAEYLAAHPKAIVTITGYADKGTGTMAINLRLSMERANTVCQHLIKNYGISRDRIRVESMGEAMYQPYQTPEQNRVAICIAEEL